MRIKECFRIYIAKYFLNGLTIKLTLILRHVALNQVVIRSLVFITCNFSSSLTPPQIPIYTKIKIKKIKDEEN